MIDPLLYATLDEAVAEFGKKVAPICAELRIKLQVGIEANKALGGLEASTSTSVTYLDAETKSN